MKLIITLIILSFASQCSRAPVKKGAPTPQRIKGDLYFKFIDLFDTYQLPDSILNELKAMQTDQKDTLDADYKSSYELIEFANKYDLLGKPKICLRQADGDIISVFMEEDDYQQFVAYKWGELRSDSLKVSVVAEAFELMEDEVYKLKTLVQVEKIPGITYSNK